MDSKGNYTSTQAREIGFDRSEYTPAAVGVFMGRLVMKVYGDFCIRCYFVTDGGEKLKLTAWQNRRTGRYGPRGCETDFKDVPLQTVWSNRVEKSKTGKPAWTAAAQIS